MEPYEQIAQAFHKRIDCIAGAVDAMAPGIEAASHLILQAALQDRKLLIFAGSQDAPFGDHLVNLLRTPVDSRPALPAISIGAREAPDNDPANWHDIKTLSRDGDVLLCIDSISGAAIARACSQIASQRNLVTISMSELFEHGKPTVCIDLRADERALRRELIVMACHCLQEQLGQQMLGG
jgi:DnaA initiator-associating protein